MSKEGVKKLFIDFNKLDENSQRNKQGTGLGLSICKKIIEQMGGSVSVTSKVGVGSEFIINVKTKCKVKKCQLANEITQVQKGEPFVFLHKGCFEDEQISFIKNYSDIEFDTEIKKPEDLFGKQTKMLSKMRKKLDQ
jgi:hypothetical protein